MILLAVLALLVGWLIYGGYVRGRLRRIYGRMARLHAELSGAGEALEQYISLMQGATRRQALTAEERLNGILEAAHALMRQMTDGAQSSWQVGRAARETTSWERAADRLERTAAELQTELERLRKLERRVQLLLEERRQELHRLRSRAAAQRLSGVNEELERIAQELERIAQELEEAEAIGVFDPAGAAERLADIETYTTALERRLRQRDRA